jgi:hypothetical protein
MVFRGHHPIFGCIDHSILPREFHSPDQRRKEKRGTLERVPSLQVFEWKAERLALAFQSNSMVHLRRDKVERVSTSSSDSRSPSRRRLDGAMVITLLGGAAAAAANRPIGPSSWRTDDADF